jgi:hydroxyacylglutathione hydrolase
LGIPIYVHPADRENLHNPGSDGLPLFAPITGVKEAIGLSDGQNMQVGNLSFEVIHLPGHTPGGVGFWFYDHNLLISGDTLFKGTIGNVSFPTANRNHMKESLARLAKLPPSTRVIPGHGKSTTLAEESWILQGGLKF